MSIDEDAIGMIEVLYWLVAMSDTIFALIPLGFQT
jgi:hypothetical protein